ncbi:MAG: response regulator transcription factor [Parcubacteria group bacterium]
MRLLIVEDEPKIAQALKRGLEQAAFAVDLASDFITGQQKALNGPYDLIILDRMLPGGDGAEIIKVLRATNKTTPTLLLTARDSIGDRVQGLNLGADDYLVKPFAFAELLARIHVLLRRPQSTSAGPELRVANLTLNPSTFNVTRADRNIELSVKEFALLEYLMCQAGKTLSKDQLIAHVWNFDADVLPNTVEVFIGYLRNKIDKPFKGPPLIQTVRGFGYRLGEPKR